MTSKTFAVIGDPIDHSLSPNIHSAAFREMRLNCSYIAYKISKDELEEGVHSLKNAEIAGFNVTIPHKISMMKYLDKTDESCSMAGAVNTVVNDGGLLKGYNTDMDGFLDPLKKKDITINGTKILLLGAGGAARAITAALAREHAGHITIANRTSTNARELTLFAKRMGLDANPVSTIHAVDAARNHDIIINATSIGLNKEESPISFKGIKKNTTVYDIVYRPMKTDFTEKAKAEGATIIYGYEMLLGQAVRSFEIWHHTQAPYNAMKRALLGGA